MTSANMKKILGAVAALLVCGQVMAAGPGESGNPFDGGAWSVQFGTGEGNQRLTINRETAPLWTHNFSSSRIELVGELGLSYWWTTQDVDPGAKKSVWQANAIPMFRYWPTQQIYVEAGVGATFFSDTRFHNKDISTSFQFGDHIGAGYQLSRNTRIGLRVSHFSNLSIKRPNPGINNIAINIATTF
jgi:lipid A 3-O-deacylase